MPNLTIKPIAGGSNKLILQDQQGGTVLETGGSGATIANATLNTPTIANMSNCTFPAGCITQVKQTVLNTSTDVATTTETEFLRVTITPSATSSKIFVIVTGGEWGHYVGAGYMSKGFLYRDSTLISHCVGTTRESGNQAASTSLTYLDSPSSTSAIAYIFKAASSSTNNVTVVVQDRGPLMITAMEVMG
jgi:hypothetical protein